MAVSENTEAYILILEIEIRKFLQDIASTCPEEPVRTSELWKNMANKEIFDLICDWTTFAKDNCREGSYHSQSAFLLPIVLLIVWSCLIPNPKISTLFNPPIS